MELSVHLAIDMTFIFRIAEPETVSNWIIINDGSQLAESITAINLLIDDQST